MSIYQNIEEKQLLHRYKELYASGQPFPNCILENVLNEEMTDRIIEEWPEPQDGRWNHLPNLTAANAGNKREITNIRDMGPATREAISFFQSGIFCEFLEQITGNTGLIPDPHLFGGGLNAVSRGGLLRIHADFNFYDRLRLYRRLNLIYYLNRDWNVNWGGGLELWNPDMSQRVTTIPCGFNTAGLFGVHDQAFHGYPNPVLCPINRERRSINLYYYTVVPNENQSSIPHRTLWRNRPNENVEFIGY